jgi:hypothetical protein
MTWCPRHDIVDTWAIRVSPPARSWPPTMAGAPLSRAPSTRATGSPVMRSPGPMATAACCLAARRSHLPVGQRPSPCSPAGSQRLDSRSVSVWTTVCPVPPIPAPVWHRSQLGGCAWASGRSASNPVNPRQTAATQRAPQHPCDRFRQACHCERPHEALCDHRHGLLVVFQQHASDRWPALRGECHARSPRLNSSIVP